MSGSRLPDFIIVGAMKAGTTTLFRYLADHPGIFMPELKEPDFFVTQKNFGRGFDWYRALFDPAPPGALLGEGSTNYSKARVFPGVPERLREHVPDVKLVYLLRDPIERIRSNYVHNTLTGRENRPPGEALRPGSAYLETSLYGYQLERYLEHFPAEQILLLLNEDLRDDPAALLKRVQDFLGVEQHTFPDLGRRDHASDQRRGDRALGALLRRNRRLLFWARQAVPAPVRARIRRGLTREIDTSAISVPDSAFDPLRDALAADRDLLQRIYPLDLSKWAPLG